MMLKSNDEDIGLRDFFPTVKPLSSIMHGANRYLSIGLHGISACTDLTSTLNRLESIHCISTKLKTLNKILKDWQDIFVRPLSLSEEQIFQHWNRPGQQDSYDLLAYVINDVHSELHHGITDSEENFKIKLPMQVSLEVVCCSDCKDKKSLQLDLALQIPIIKMPYKNYIALQDLLESYLNEETINEKCNDCCFKKRRTLLTFPNTLLIRLQRFYWKNGKLQVVSDSVKFKEVLTLKPSYLPSNNTRYYHANNQRYNLKSVIAQNPNDLFEHNICYKLMKKDWFCVTESSVMKEEFRNILNCNAYILFYEKSTSRSASAHSLSFDLVNREDLKLHHFRINNTRNPPVDSIKPNLLKSEPPVPLLSPFSKTKDEEKKKIHSSRFNIKNTRNPFVNARKQPIFLVSPFSKGTDDEEKIINLRTKICCFQLFQSEIVLIEALSSCRYFVKVLKLVNCENMEQRYQQMIKCILNRSLKPSRKITIQDADILRDFKNFLNATFGNEFNRSMIKLSGRNYVQCPFNVSIMSEIKCICNDTTLNVIKSKFGVKVFNFCINLQRSLDLIFKVEKEVTLSDNNKRCKCTSGYSRCRLSQPIPKMICIYSKIECCLFNIKQLKELVIKNSYFSQSQVDAEEISENIEKGISNKIDHKYFLKSMICSLNNEYESYQMLDDTWYHFKGDKSNKIDESSNLFGKWHILFFEKLKETIKSKPKNIEFVSDNSSKISVDDEILRNWFDFSSNSKNISGSNKSYFLQICFHAFSSCKNFVNEIQNILTTEMERSNLFIKYVSVKLQPFGNFEIPVEVAKELQLHEETNLFQFLMKLLSNLSKEWKMNPFLISKRITIRCFRCAALQNDDLSCSLSFNIPVSSSVDNIDIQDVISSYFKVEILKNFDCVKEDCNEKECQFLSKLCTPYPSVICIKIDKIIWDGVKNIILNSSIQISELILIKHGYLDNPSSINQKNKDLKFILQSVISFTESLPLEYFCFKKVNANWYKISKSSTHPVSLKDVMTCKPYIMFYELIEK